MGTKDEDKALFEAYINGNSGSSDRDMQQYFEAYLKGEIKKTECSSAGAKGESDEEKRKLFEEHLANYGTSGYFEYPPERKVYRRKKIGKGTLKKINAQDSLDLHGDTIRVAKQKLPAFIQKAWQKGKSPVIVVHGKGLHSGGKSVLREYVEEYISSGGIQYIEKVVKAPPHLGGSGAKLIWLREK